MPCKCQGAQARQMPYISDTLSQVDANLLISAGWRRPLSKARILRYGSTVVQDR